MNKKFKKNIIKAIVMITIIIGALATNILPQNNQTVYAGKTFTYCFSVDMEVEPQYRRKVIIEINEGSKVEENSKIEIWTLDDNYDPKDLLNRVDLLGNSK